MCMTIIVASTGLIRRMFSCSLSLSFEQSNKTLRTIGDQSAFMRLYNIYWFVVGHDILLFLRLGPPSVLFFSTKMCPDDYFKLQKCQGFSCTDFQGLRALFKIISFRSRPTFLVTFMTLKHYLFEGQNHPKISLINRECRRPHTLLSAWVNIYLKWKICLSEHFFIIPEISVSFFSSWSPVIMNTCASPKDIY